MPKVSKEYEKVFLSAPQLNPANSGKLYQRPYKKTKNNTDAKHSKK